MKLLFVASECAPFVKTGGLADVIGAVPKALTGLGADVRVLLPAYPALKPVMKGGRTVLKFDDLFGGPARLVARKAEGLNMLLLDAPHLFDRPGNIYLDQNGRDWGDNHLRFGGLSLVASEIALGMLKNWVPDVVNLHDWQASLAVAYMRQSGKACPPTITTIHNIAFQGMFDGGLLGTLGLGREYFTSEGFEYYGKINFLKAGIALSDKISTVSPTYARELIQPEFGMGMEGLLKARQGDLVGILNGIDLDVWNPETDPNPPQKFTIRSLKKKAVNKAQVEARFGLKPAPDAPLFCVISRLTQQKGLDLLLECLPGLVGRGARLALVGSGDANLEAGYLDAVRKYPGQVGVVIGYDEALSHQMQAGSDAILIPSRFEPCGLTQLYGLRYGTIPVVARTGGLADTVIDANEAAMTVGCATGVQFAPINAATLDQAIGRTCDLYHDKAAWTPMIRRAMRHPVGWDVSAKAYLALYQSLLPGNKQE